MVRSQTHINRKRIGYQNNIIRCDEKQVCYRYQRPSRLTQKFAIARGIMPSGTSIRASKSHPKRRRRTIYPNVRSTTQRRTRTLKLFSRSRRRMISKVKSRKAAFLSPDRGRPASPSADQELQATRSQPSRGRRRPRRQCGLLPINICRMPDHAPRTAGAPPGLVEPAQILTVAPECRRRNPGARLDK